MQFLRGLFFKSRSTVRRGFLSRLSRDVRGNTLAIVAAAMVPLIGLVGSGVDLSRLYIVKTRLQHACDAGALAGRKTMGGGTWSYNSYAARSAANKFFDANIQASPYGATNLTRTFSESAGKVSGTASAVVGMTLMRVMGEPSRTLTVTCDAEMRLPNTDIMFVLDMSGSMNCVAGDAYCTNNGNVPASGSKIDGLKFAVKCFYEIVAKVDTDAACPTGTPSGGLSNDIQVRFGFMPYTSNVRVGKLIPPSYFADSWDYQTRSLNSGGGWADWSMYSYYWTNSYSTCNSAPSNTSSRQYKVEKNTYYGSYYCGYYSRDRVIQWQYKQSSVNVSLLKNGTSWRDSFQWPIADDGGDRTINWDGCVEIRGDDTDINLVPSAGAGNLWGMSLPDLIYLRSVTTSWSQLSRSTSVTSTNYYNNISYSCPTTAKKLQVWSSATDFDNYVNSLTAAGNTYHDAGLLWGGRFISPKGIFASSNATTPSGGSIERNLIFMTDGNASAGYYDYAMHGVNWFDVLPSSTGAPRYSSDESAMDATLTNLIKTRTEALCTAIKNENITLWVVSYGGGLDSDNEARLQNCATPGKYFSASNSTTLLQTFSDIANQITQLRLTK